MKKLHVKATFIEPVLGTWPANPNVAREFIASKSPDAATIEDEVAALGPDAVADKGMTVFPRDPDGNPIFYDYQIKGMFKDACGIQMKRQLRRKKEGRGSEEEHGNCRVLPDHA